MEIFAVTFLFMIAAILHWLSTYDLGYKNGSTTSKSNKSNCLHKPRK